MKKINPELETKKSKSSTPKLVCDLLVGGICNSSYADNLKCDGIKPPKKCPYSDGGNLEMNNNDHNNRRKRPYE